MDKKAPIYLNINIQSLLSKFNQLKTQILELLERNVKIDVISIQETWEVRYPDQFTIPGFQKFICKTRDGTRGGGVGFYIRDGLNFEIMDALSPFETKILESQTIKLIYPNRKNALLTCIYRSNGILPGVTAAQQMERFFTNFDELLHKLSLTKLTSYVFMDSNIDLLNLRVESATTFLDIVTSKGYLQCIFKATRFQNESKALIDNILTNNTSPANTGTIISDISDHFFTFLQTANPIPINSEKRYTYKQYTEINLNNFKAALVGMDWSPVLESVDVDESCNEFWSIYKNLHDLTFPEKTVRFNKRIHCRQPFMSAGILKSRETKNSLFRATLSNASPNVLQRFKTYQKLYFKTVRAAKKMYFTNKLKENAKNPKKHGKL